MKREKVKSISLGEGIDVRRSITYIQESHVQRRTFASGERALPERACR